MSPIFRCEHACSEGHSLAAAAFGLALAMLVPVAASGAEPSPTPDQPEGNQSAGGYRVTDNANHGEVTVFAPSGGNNDALLLDDSKLFKADVRESNFAFGYRQMVRSRRNPGIRSRIDRHRVNTDNAFWQVADGLRYGIDGKVGVRLFGHNLIGDEAILRRGELWIYGGGIRFSGDGALSGVTGPNVRAEWRFDDLIEELPGSRLTLGGEFSNDHIRSDKWQFGLRLRIPFGGPTGGRILSYTSL